MVVVELVLADVVVEDVELLPRVVVGVDVVVEVVDAVDVVVVFGTEATVIVLLPNAPLLEESSTLAVTTSVPMSFASAGSAKLTELLVIELLICAANTALPVLVLVTAKLYVYGGTPPVTLAVSDSYWPCAADWFDE